MLTVPFKQVDVFTDTAFRGNPLAVILDARHLDTAAMQHIARWTNLSETTFVLPPSERHAGAASYRVRIFTPTCELPFAGHPSVGTAHAVLEAGIAKPILDASGRGRLVQECEAGLLPITVDTSAGTVSIRAPEGKPLPDPPGVEALVNDALAGLARGPLAPKLYDTGPLWWLAQLADGAAVRAYVPNLQAIRALTLPTSAIGLAFFGFEDAPDHSLVVRAYCPGYGIDEDPVTGSANAGIGAYLLHAGRLRPGDRYVASQGREVGRHGRVAVHIDDEGQVSIGGHAVTTIDGTIRA
ncbi:PhzF family phenazine biosynthesis protein [Pendulispora albinea]|uniref:PhzF family phenazine biosynthesis protein n=1 Tax=Pendulispora albinea TaxID=2741071 RepID=A0ABZ2LZ09_9BACT